MEQFVTDILPKLSNEQLARVLQRFDEIGVEEQSDLEYVEERDLLQVLKPVQARKLMRNWKKEPEVKIDAVTTMAESLNAETTMAEIIHAAPTVSTVPAMSSHVTAESLLSEAFSCPMVDSLLTPSATSPPPQDWAYQFDIPWHKFPPALLTACKQNLRPDPSHRKEMVRVLVDEILLITRRPGRKNLDRVAFKIVSKYPSSFRDGFNGGVMGEGHSSLTNQLLNRLENTIRKEKRLGHPSRCVRKEGTSKRKSVDCSIWSGDSDDGKEMMHWQKLWLAEEFEKRVRDEKIIHRFMKDTFLLQREEITEQTPVKTIQTDWPFLLEKDCLLSHYCTLVGKEEDNIEFIECFFSRALSVYRALKTSNQTGMSELISKVKEECRACGNDAPKAARLPDILACCFKEDVSYVYRTFNEESDLIGILAGLPSTPIVVVLGQSPTTSRTQYVCMKNVAISKSESFLDALALAFCSFYVFKFTFPDEAMVTFEFLQRYFAGINSLGKSGPRKKARHQVHPKVLSLTKKIVISEQASSGTNVIAVDDVAAV